MSSRVYRSTSLLLLLWASCGEDQHSIALCGRGDHDQLTSALAGGSFELTFRDLAGNSLGQPLTVPADRRTKIATAPQHATSVEVVGRASDNTIVAHGTGAVDAGGGGCACVALLEQEKAACANIACSVAMTRCTFVDATSKQAASAQTIVFGENSTDDVSKVTADTKLHSQQANTVFGGDSSIGTDTQPPMTALLRFELAALPQSATVDVAVLAFDLVPAAQNPSSGSNQPIDFFQILESWSESSATWEHRDSANLWSVAGCRYDSQASKQSRATNAGAALVKPATPGMTYTVDITDLVRAWVSDPSSNFGLSIEATGDEVDIVAHEDTTPGAMRPQLAVQYHLDP